MARIVLTKNREIESVKQIRVTGDRRIPWNGMFDFDEFDFVDYNDLWDNMLANMDRRNQYEPTDGKRYFKVGVIFTDSLKNKKSIMFIFEKYSLYLVGYELPEIEGMGKEDFILDIDDVRYTDSNEVTLKKEYFLPAIETAYAYIMEQSHNRSAYNQNKNWFAEPNCKKSFLSVAFFLSEAARVESSRVAARNIFTENGPILLPMDFFDNGRTEEQIREALAKRSNHTLVFTNWEAMTGGNYNQMVTLNQERNFFSSSRFNANQKEKMRAIGVEV